MSNYKEDLIEFFEYLTSKQKVGGLQITDSYVRYVLLKRGESVYALSVQLPPGVVSEGKVEDKETLIQYLSKLNEAVNKKTDDKESRVVVSLPSSIVYTQNFDIPNVGRDRLSETAELNLKMNSPIPADSAYMSWELIAETMDRYDILGAFTKREHLDKFRTAMLEAGFHPLIFESPSLSLSWVVNKLVGVRDDVSLVVNVSSDGLDIFLLKRGYIYFDYFRSWRSIQGERDRIHKEKFRQAVVDELNRVLNFMRGHFEGDLERVFFVAPGLEDIVKDVIDEKLDIQARALRGEFGKLNPSWYSTIGAALRGTWERGRDHFISLGAEKMEEIFYKERIISFVKLWRNIAAGVIGVFLVLYGVAAFLISNQPALTQERESLISNQAQRELSRLSSKAEKFNSLASSMAEVRGSGEGVVLKFMNDLTGVMDRFNVTPARTGIDRGNQNVTLEANAEDYSTVINFKDALVSSNKFSNVNLPLSQVTDRGGGRVSFVISFQYSPDSDS